MKETLEYKGYVATVKIDFDDGVLFGKIEGINDLVNFEGTNLEEVKKAFQEAVDDYLEFCQTVGKTPDKAYKGSFNIRVDSELHRRAAVIAVRRNISLNQFVAEAIEEAVENAYTTRIERTVTKDDDVRGEIVYYTARDDGPRIDMKNVIDFPTKGITWK